MDHHNVPDMAQRPLGAGLPQVRPLGGRTHLDTHAEGHLAGGGVRGA